MYVKYDIEARSRNSSCRWKAVSITCYEFVSVALGIQQEMPMCNIITVGRTVLPFFFFHIIS